jgi:hypothetical protein
MDKVRVHERSISGAQKLDQRYEFSCRGEVDIYRVTHTGCDLVPTHLPRRVAALTQMSAHELPTNKFRFAILKVFLKSLE